MAITSGMWRLMLRYPELLAWEMLWTDSLRETYAAIYERVKSIKPSMQVGWHIWHNNSFNPIYRAEQDLQAIAPHSDFLKMVMYHNCAGERMARYIDNVGSSIYGDIPKQELLDFHYRVLDYKERGLDEIPYTGFSSDYVFRETKRARAGLEGTKTQLWPGIDVDIPTEENTASARRSEQGRNYGGVSGWGRWGADFAQVLGDATWKSQSRGNGDQRIEAGVALRPSCARSGVSAGVRMRRSLATWLDIPGPQRRGPPEGAPEPAPSEVQGPGTSGTRRALIARLVSRESRRNRRSLDSLRSLGRTE